MGKEKFTIPENLNLEEIFIANNMKKEIKLIPKYEYFIDLIYSKQTKPNEFVNLSSTLIRKNITCSTTERKIKNNLESLGIINRNKNYRPGFYCQGYSISEKYLIQKDIFNTNNTGTNTSTNYIKENTINYTQLGIDYLMLGGFYTKENNCIELEKSNRELVDNKQEERYKKMFARIDNSSSNRIDDLLKNKALPEYAFVQKCILATTMDEGVFEWIEKKVEERMPLKSIQVEFVKNGKKYVIGTSSGL